MSGNRRIAIIATLALALVAGCSSDTDGADTGIPPQDPELVAAGAALYQASCATCHGSDLRGTDLGPSHLSKVYEPSHHADIAFLFAVQQGSQAHHWRFGDMPPVPGLTESDVAAIVAFVRETQRIEGFEPYPP
jgi:mono/diheme cytochrome c family protein